MTSGVTPTPSFYADPAGLSGLKQAVRNDSPEALREAARQFESLFTQMMLKSMRAATFGDSLAGSETTQFYQEMHDTQLALELSKGKGLGLADMLVRQLTQSGLATGSAHAAGGADVTDSADVIGSTGLLPQVSVAPAAGGGPSIPGAGGERGSSLQWPPRSREEFVQMLRPYAEKAGESLGVEADTLLAHAALETGWGSKVPDCADGSCSYNLFGIKAGSRWEGSTVGVSTLEFENGVASRRVERFRAYASPADSFADYAALLGGAGRYEDALGAGNDAARFAQGLVAGGYATDPRYAEKLVRVADSLRAVSRSGTASALKTSGEVPITGPTPGPTSGPTTGVAAGATEDPS